MKKIKEINWAWALVVAGFAFGFAMLWETRLAEREVKAKEKIVDSLSNEILILEEQIEMREREADLLMDLTHDDFDKEVEVDKIERLLKDDK
jgi:transposase